MTQSETKPGSLGNIAEDSPDDFDFPRGGSGRRKLPDVTTPAQTGTRRKKMSKRVKQFTTKADPKVLEEFYAVLDNIEVSTTAGFEMAVKEFIKHNSA